MSYITITPREPREYDYKDVIVDNSRVSLYIYGFENFGWEVEENQVKIVESNKAGKTLIHFKRSRKILNRAELTRLQRNFEDNMKQIASLENSKTNLATGLSVSMGIVGVLIIAGAVMIAVESSELQLVSVALSIPGFVMAIMANFAYGKLVQLKEAKIRPLVDKKMNEIYEICDKGRKLLL